MKERQVAQRIAARQKRSELRRRGVPLVALDQRARVQIGERPALILRRIRFLDLREQLREIAPLAVIFERAELRGPLLDAVHRGERLSAGRGCAEDAVPWKALPGEKENNREEEYGDDGDDDVKSAALRHESSRASVPETIAWGARLRISYLAIG